MVRRCLSVADIPETFCDIVHLRPRDLMLVKRTSGRYTSHGERVRATLCPNVDRARPVSKVVHSLAILAYSDTDIATGVLVLFLYLSDLVCNRLLVESYVCDERVLS